MSTDLICPICGEPTRVYMGNARKDRLCGKHADMLKAGTLVLDGNSFVEVGAKTSASSKPVSSDKCPICGEPTKGKEVCISCYREIRDCFDDLDKNQKSWELKDYFYNLNANIYRLKEISYVPQQLHKLFAIAWLVRDLYHDEQLSDVVAGYAKKIMETKQKAKNVKVSDQDRIVDKARIALSNKEHRSSDGHVCDSPQEVTIDNILYKSHICHACHPQVKEIPVMEERAVFADWFVPLSGTDGIYIEYWGAEGAEGYLKNKEEKKPLYEKYDVKLIEIEKNDINDISTLENRLFQELRRLGWK